MPFIEGGDVFGPGLGLDLRAGYYVTPHIAIVGGLRLSSHIVKSCEGCKGAGIQLPVLVQFAASRTRGIYGEAGVGLLSIYAVSKGDTTARIATPVVLKLDIGRIGQRRQEQLLATVIPVARASATKASYARSASSGAIAPSKLGRRPLLTSP